MLELSEASVHHMFVNARAAVRVRRCGKKIASPYDAAWGRGVRFGRLRKLSPHRRRAAIDRLNACDSVVDVACTFGVDRATPVSDASGSGPVHGPSHPPGSAIGDRRAFGDITNAGEPVTIREKLCPNLLIVEGDYRLASANLFPPPPPAVRAPEAPATPGLFFFEPPTAVLVIRSASPA